MKKVMLFNHLAYPDAITGAEKSLVLLARVLVKNKYEIRAVSPCLGIVTQELRNLGASIKVIPYHSHFREMMYPAPGFLERLEQVKKNGMNQMLELHRAVNLYQPDLAIVNSVVNVLSATVAKARGIPVIWFIREPIVSEENHTKESVRLVGRLSNLVVANSAEIAALFAGNGLQKKVVFLPNAVDLGLLQEERWAEFRQKLREKLGIKEGQCLVGYLGALSEVKGPEHFIEMAGKVGSQVPGTVFCLAGSSDSERYLIKLKKVALEKASGVPIHFLGFWQNINSLLPAFDLVVVPSLVAEGCPRVVLEAMAFAKPVVAYQVGGVSELVRQDQTGYLAPLKNMEGFAAQVLTLVKDPARRVIFGQEARRLIETGYSMDRYEEKLKTILSGI
ncbi:MAG: glycosyltransferase family 4 protein [Syntrophomonadaceae bacterium]|nr:glycosyltransferase family 4 protein [Syntrophomonadaceae bacterium]